METKYPGPPKVGSLQNSSSEQGDKKQRQDQIRKEVTLVAQKEALFMKNMLKTISM